MNPPRRPLRFLPRKITSTGGAHQGSSLEHELVLGNIEAMRDWSSAKDVVESMWMMLQQEKPEDYVIGSGEMHSVKDILDIAFGALDLDWKKIRAHRPGFHARPRKARRGGRISTKAKAELGWSPKTSFERNDPCHVRGRIWKLCLQAEANTVQQSTTAKAI